MLIPLAMAAMFFTIDIEQQYTTIATALFRTIKPGATMSYASDNMPPTSQDARTLAIPSSP